MENDFSIGDTVSFNWNGYTMVSIIINKLMRFSDMPFSNEHPIKFSGVPIRNKKPRFIVEVNFDRKSTYNRSDEFSTIVNGTTNADSIQLSTCRMVLIEKTNKLFADYGVEK